MANCTGALDSKQKDIAIIVFSSVGLVSLISCVLTIILLFYLKLHKRFIYRLAMYQVISSMMVSVSAVSAITATSSVQDYSETLYNGICQANGFFLTYTVWVKLLFTSSLTIHLFLMAVCLKEYKKAEKVYVLTSIIFPFLLCWIPFVGDHYGPAGTYCWITDKNTSCSHGNTSTMAMGVGAIEQLALWHVPSGLSLLLCILATIIASTVLIWRGMRKIRLTSTIDGEMELLIQKQRQTKKALLEVAPLLAYPAIFFIFNGFATVNRIYNVFEPLTNFGLWIVHSVTVGLWGICSSIALLVHITVTRCLNKRKINDSDLRTAHTGKDNIGVFTTCETRSYYNIPRESIIDKFIEDKKETSTQRDKTAYT